MTRGSCPGPSPRTRGAASLCWLITEAGAFAGASPPALAKVPEGARHPLIELGAERRCRCDAERRYRSAVVDAVEVVHVSPSAPEQHHGQPSVPRAGDEHADGYGITHERPVSLKLPRPWRSCVHPRHLPNRETGRQPPSSPLSDYGGCLIKIDDTFHERIVPHCDATFH